MGVYLGVTTGMWQLALMSLTSALAAMLAARLRARAPKELGEVRITRSSIWIGARRLPRARWLWLPRWRRAVLLKLKEPQTELFVSARPKPLNFIAGFGFELNLAEHGPHLFLVGPTGAGKSRWLNLLLRSLVGPVRLLLADYKGGATLKPFGNCVTDLDPPESREGFWQTLSELLEERERYLALHGVSRASEVSLKPVVIVIDELAHALRIDRSAHQVVSSVAARGRSLAIHLVCANQSVSGVPRDILVNLGLRVVLAGTDEVDALQLGAKEKPTAKPGFGAGIAVGLGAFSFPFSQEPIREQPSQAREP